MNSTNAITEESVRQLLHSTGLAILDRINRDLAADACLPAHLACAKRRAAFEIARINARSRRVTAEIRARLFKLELATYGFRPVS